MKIKSKKNLYIKIFIPIFFIILITTVCSFYFFNNQKSLENKEINQLGKEKVIVQEVNENHVAEEQQDEVENKFSILDFKEFFDEDEQPAYSKKNNCYYSTKGMYCVKIDEEYESIENDKIYY